LDKAMKGLPVDDLGLKEVDMKTQLFETPAMEQEWLACSNPEEEAVGGDDEDGMQN
jgi:hypothetical protein